MTQEEKARAYDEALDKMKRWADGTLMPPDESPKTLCEIIFPELHESEDERIRKFLVDYFTSYKIGNVATKLNGVRIDDILNYLEKQKESLHISETCKENANSFTDGVIEVRSFRRGLEEGRRLEKQKKQKPAEYLSKDKVYAIMNKLTELSTSELIPLNSDEYKKINEITSDVRSLLDYPIGQKPEDYAEELKKCKDNPLYFYDKYVKVKQKPAEWSEEDSDNLERVDNYLWMLDDYVGDDCATPQGKVDKIRENIQEVLSPWLKSLPERFNLQPKQEWSEDTLDEFTHNIRTLITNKLTTKIKGLDGSEISSTVFIDDKTAKDIANGILFYVGKEAIKNPNREIPEWSEEDEKMLENIRYALRYAYFNSVIDEQTTEYVMDWLKSLRPSWKPSEAQLMALHSMIDDESDTIGNEQLKLLYNDLKKL